MVNDCSLVKEISLSVTGDRGSECDDCHIRSHVFCIRSHESLFCSHERQIRSGRIVCNPLAEWVLCFFSSEVSQFLSSESEVISASSSAIPHWAVKAPVLFLHLWSYVCCLDFDCKVRHFFLNTQCTSMTCTIVNSVKKIKGFYTHWEVFCHSAVLPPNWNNPYKCGQKCGQIPSVPPYYQYFIPFFSRCLYINVEMNRHGSSFGSNNCSKRVVNSVFSHFCKRWVLA